MARLLALLSMLLAVSIAGLARADSGRDTGCTSSQPVLISQAKPDTQWQLPLSSDRPMVLTEARISIEFLHPTSEHKLWIVRILASFPDPMPLGLPYTYQKIAFAWNAPEASGTAILDWTSDCHSPGRSLFPGQKWAQDWEIPGTEGLSRLDDLSFALWGSRN